MPKAKMDRSVERERGQGTYRKRLDDAFDAMNRVGNLEKLSPVAAFVFYYLTCEKVAKVLVAIDRGTPGPGQDFSTMSNVERNIVRACKKIVGRDMIVSDDDIKLIFAGIDKYSARNLRRKLFHDFGPTHVREVEEAAPRLNPLMAKFLKCRRSITAFLDGA